MKEPLPYAEVTLTRGKVAMVDWEDFDWIKDHRWHAVPNRTGTLWYAHRHIRQEDGRFKTTGMHRLILNAPSNMEVDHKNGNGLDNRRSNIRLATRSENQCNSRFRSRKSGFKGVTPYQRTENVRWKSTIMQNGVSRHLGYYSSAIEAAKAYDKAALEVHGEFARLNFRLDAEDVDPWRGLE